MARSSKMARYSLPTICHGQVMTLYAGNALPWPTPSPGTAAWQCRASGRCGCDAATAQRATSPAALQVLHGSATSPEQHLSSDTFTGLSSVALQCASVRQLSQLRHSAHLSEIRVGFSMRSPPLSLTCGCNQASLRRRSLTPSAEGHGKLALHQALHRTPQPGELGGLEAPAAERRCQLPLYQTLH